MLIVSRIAFYGFITTLVAFFAGVVVVVAGLHQRIRTAPSTYIIGIRGERIKTVSLCSMTFSLFFFFFLVSEVRKKSILSIFHHMVTGIVLDFR